MQQRFVGVSRDVGLALRAHQHVQGRKAVARVAVQSFRFPKREEMGNYQAMWLAELAAAPEGNREDGDGGWGGSIKDVRRVLLSVCVFFWGSGGD